ncbi:hypothetical protein BC937DRAFT_91993 [Endogone sp. FLAS-F59071]|nr:hypothetical protein BC937DRAFT_91993 [Endogone sp. FLAS-F59071]|eukprot:RUS15791.1 hypothetical protein BC937DRAFT_91993 [Endogone sp. FLAS-F59071]
MVTRTYSTIFGASSVFAGPLPSPGADKDEGTRDDGTRERGNEGTREGNERLSTPPANFEPSAAATTRRSDHCLRIPVPGAAPTDRPYG